MFGQAVFAVFNLRTGTCEPNHCDYFTAKESDLKYHCLLFLKDLEKVTDSDYYDYQALRCKECLDIFSERTNSLKRLDSEKGVRQIGREIVDYRKYKKENGWDLK